MYIFVGSATPTACHRHLQTSITFFKALLMIEGQRNRTIFHCAGVKCYQFEPYKFKVHFLTFTFYITRLSKQFQDKIIS